MYLKTLLLQTNNVGHISVFKEFFKYLESIDTYDFQIS